MSFQFSSCELSVNQVLETAQAGGSPRSLPISAPRASPLKTEKLQPTPLFLLYHNGFFCCCCCCAAAVFFAIRKTALLMKRRVTRKPLFLSRRAAVQEDGTAKQKPETQICPPVHIVAQATSRWVKRHYGSIQQGSSLPGISSA